MDVQAVGRKTAEQLAELLAVALELRGLLRGAPQRLALQREIFFGDDPLGGERQRGRHRELDEQIGRREYAAVMAELANTGGRYDGEIGVGARERIARAPEAALVPQPVDEVAAERAHARRSVDLRVAELAVRHAVPREQPRRLRRRRQLVAHLDAVLRERIEQHGVAIVRPVGGGGRQRFEPRQERSAGIQLEDLAIAGGRDRLVQQQLGDGGRGGCRVGAGADDRLKAGRSPLGVEHLGNLEILRVPGVLAPGTLGEDAVAWAAEFAPEVVFCTLPLNLANARRIARRAHAPILLHAETWLDSAMMARRYYLWIPALRPWVARALRLWYRRQARAVAYSNPSEIAALRSSRGMHYLPWPHPR